MRVAGLARAGPAIFDAGQSFAIKLDGAFGACALAQHLCVKDGDREEDERARSSHHGEKASRWRENQAAISVAMTRRRRIFPKRRCTFSK